MPTKIVMKNSLHINKIFHFFSIIIVVLSIITSGFGLFYKTNGQSYIFINQYTDIVKIFGNGIYKNDSFFMASIFRGTDFTILFIAIPLMIIALIFDIKNNTIKSKLFLISLITLFTYYSVSISFGFTYNILHLIYIALFGCSFYTLIMGFSILKKYQINIPIKVLTNGLKIFLIICGLSLFIAWLPDIITSLLNNKSLALIEIYTTQITYVLDMGIISPLIFICLYNLWVKNNFGYILLGIILNMLIFVGIMVINQTVFQSIAGISSQISVIITKVGIFVILAIFAIYYSIKLFKNIKCNENVV